MNRTSTFLLIILSWCLLPGLINGQIVIGYEDFPKPENSEVFRFQANPENIQIPTFGEDQVWDYSNLQPVGSTTTTYFSAEGDPDFPDATYVTPQQLFFQGFEFGSRLYEGLDENGNFRLGQITADTTFSITTISGGPNDILRFVGTPVRFEGRLDFIKFPLAYGDSWTETRKERLPFELTVAAFGLNSVPGWRNRTVTQTRTVTGWGQLTTPNRDGNPNPPRDVLLMWVEGTTVDSIFLGGAPAPPPLMDAFGLTQGQTFTSEFTLFYEQHDESNLMRVNIESDGSVSSVFFKPDHNSTTSVRDVSLIPAIAFPNPVSQLQELTIQTDQPISNGRFMLFDINGREVYNRAFNSMHGQHLSVPISGHLSPGMHIFHLMDGKGEVRSIGKVNVQ